MAAVGQELWVRFVPAALRGALAACSVPWTLPWMAAPRRVRERLAAAAARLGLFDLEFLLLLFQASQLRVSRSGRTGGVGVQQHEGVV